MQPVCGWDQERDLSILWEGVAGVAIDECWVKSNREWIQVGLLDTEALSLSLCFAVAKYIHTHYPLDPQKPGERRQCCHYSPPPF